MAKKKDKKRKKLPKKLRKALKLAKAFLQGGIDAIYEMGKNPIVH